MRYALQTIKVPQSDPLYNVTVYQSDRLFQVEIRQENSSDADDIVALRLKSDAIALRDALTTIIDNWKE